MMQEKSLGNFRTHNCNYTCTACCCEILFCALQIRPRARQRRL